MVVKRPIFVRFGVRSIICLNAWVIYIHTWETQALATVTLGTSREANIIDSPSNQGRNLLFTLQLPPFCTGEARPLRGTSRREVGHGNLAQRALKMVMPKTRHIQYVWCLRS
ncbi:MAG: hypothetical protein CM15mP59_2620 [Flavobacteriaceae bacterium]|nr:MAG: hypothetical protein CM15mP59_2620 [Flavobacteriaceae bacterium]